MLISCSSVIFLTLLAGLAGKSVPDRFNARGFSVVDACKGSLGGHSWLEVSWESAGEPVYFGRVGSEAEVVTDGLFPSASARKNQARFSLSVISFPLIENSTGMK